MLLTLTANLASTGNTPFENRWLCPTALGGLSVFLRILVVPSRAAFCNSSMLAITPISPNFVVSVIICGFYCFRIIQHLAGGKILLVLDVHWILTSSSLFVVITWEDVMAQGTLP